jgi:periplasmic protein TonB
MNKETKHTIYSSSDCFSEKMLFDYIDNKLSQENRHLIEKHLLDCELCSDALEGLELVKDRARIGVIKDTINKRLISTEIKQEPKVISFNYKLVFSIAATIALLIVGVFFFNKMTLKEAAMSDLAVLKTEDNDASSSRSKLNEKEIKTIETLKTETDENSDETRSEKTKSVISDQEIAKSGDEKQQKQSSNANRVTSSSDFEDQVTVRNDKDEADKAEGAAQIHDIVPSIVAQNTAEEKEVISLVSTISQNGSTETAEDSKSAQLKNIEVVVVSSVETLSLKSTRGQAQVKSKSKAEQFNKTEKVREESKGKYRATSKKDNKSNTDSNGAGNVANEPQSASPDMEMLKIETNSSSTVSIAEADSIEKTYTIVDKMPEFPGGTVEMLKFIQKNMKIERNMNLENSTSSTKAFVQFIVEKDGNIRDPKIIKGGNPLTDNEALRIVKMMPKWIPGKLNNKVVAVRYVLPILFELK